MLITKDTYIEDLIEKHPEANAFMLKNGLGCIMCGEPFWGTIGELAHEKNFSTEKIEELTAALNEYLGETEGG